MWKKIAIAGAVGAAVLGTGAAALAETGTSSTGTPTPAATSSTSPSGGPNAAAGAKKGDLRGKLKLALGRFEHGSWVTSGKNGTGSVTHVAIKGTVSAVTPTSITVKAADATSETYVVNSDTVVRVKGSGKSSIGSVKANDTVLVAGTQSGSIDTALHVLDGGAK